MRYTARLRIFSISQFYLFIPKNILFFSFYINNIVQIYKLMFNFLLHLKHCFIPLETFIFSTKKRMKFLIENKIIIIIKSVK